MPTAQGEIIAIQEQFFRLVTDAGEGLLLTLSRRLSARVEELTYYLESRTPVEVEYEGKPGLDSAIVHRIHPISDS